MTRVTDPARCSTLSPTMADKPLVGRASIFRGKIRDKPVRGVLTPAGREAFERQRKLLASIVGRAPKDTSDGDCCEALARGEDLSRERVLGLIKKA